MLTLPSDRAPEAKSKPTLLPQWSWLIGIVLFAGASILIFRMVYESTVLTCESGPQMLGYSMMHTNPAIFIGGLLCVSVFFAWLVIALIYGASRKLRFTKREWALLVFMTSSLSLLPVPYNWWMHADALACGVGKFGSEFLVEAAADGNLSLVKKFTDQGEELDTGNAFRGFTPLGAAVANNHIEVVEYLISRGANLNFSTTGMRTTNLMIAAEKGYLPIVKTLLEHGETPCAIDNQQQNAFTLAKQYKHQDVADYLRSNFPCPDPPPPPPSSCKSESENNCVEVH
jgi:Ankyrin repeats (3 copies)